MSSAIAIANPNIAFIKYWGNRDNDLHIPSTGSISMNLEGLETRTCVQFDPQLTSDTVILNGKSASDPARQRVVKHLNLVRERAGLSEFAWVESENNFPMGTGIASSASAFAALTLAAVRAAGLELDERELSRLARRGSGSASRSVPAGFVEWLAGEDDQSSYAYSIAPPEHWHLVDCVAVVSQVHKPTGSQEGHTLADSSPLQAGRVATVSQRLQICRQAIMERDFEALAEVVELDSNMMHAVMMTSRPRLLYWQPATIGVMSAVVEWRQHGLPVCYTMDAGPNVHVICDAEFATQVKSNLLELPGVSLVLSAPPGSAARYLPEKSS